MQFFVIGKWLTDFTCGVRFFTQHINVVATEHRQWKIAKLGAVCLTTNRCRWIHFCDTFSQLILSRLKRAILLTPISLEYYLAVNKIDAIIGNSCCDYICVHLHLTQATQRDDDIKKQKQKTRCIHANFGSSRFSGCFFQSTWKITPL